MLELGEHHLGHDTPIQAGVDSTQLDAALGNLGPPLRQCRLGEFAFGALGESFRRRYNEGVRDECTSAAGVRDAALAMAKGFLDDAVEYAVTEKLTGDRVVRLENDLYQLIWTAEARRNSDLDPPAAGVTRSRIGRLSRAISDVIGTWQAVCPTSPTTTLVAGLLAVPSDEEIDRVREAWGRAEARLTTHVRPSARKIEDTLAAGGWTGTAGDEARFRAEMAGRRVDALTDRVRHRNESFNAVIGALNAAYFAALAAVVPLFVRALACSGLATLRPAYAAAKLAAEWRAIAVLSRLAIWVPLLLAAGAPTPAGADVRRDRRANA